MLQSQEPPLDAGNQNNMEKEQTPFMCHFIS